MGICDSATRACLGALLLCLCASQLGSPYPTFSPPGVLFNHSAVDPVGGTLYLGAVNRLYQLTGELEVVSQGVTGPVNDSRECAPPIRPSSCPQARPTAVHNKLLLFDREGGALLVCGSAHQGLCEKRAPGDVGQVLEREVQPGETQYVAADDPPTSTVGVVGQASGRQRALFVGRGYTHRATDAPISTRRLEGPHPFSNEEMGRLAVGGFAEYDHRFAAAFARHGYVYFIFSRRAGGARRGGGAYQAFAARICANDTNYYSYVEVPLACAGPGLQAEAYGLVQASVLGEAWVPGSSPQLTLFALFAQARPPPRQAQPSDLSALCLFPLADIDRAVERARVACYSLPDTPDARVEYNVKSSCTRLPEESTRRYPCGGEHTPSPIASRLRLESPALLTTSVRLTAVAVAKDMNHTILFLGDRLGQLHKVFLRSHSEALTYSTLTIQRGASIRQDLLLDPAQDHLYVLTSRAVTKVPVSECSRYSNCSSCLGARDPYCGWCVLDGRCCRNLECPRHKEANQWLWHYNADGQCLTVHSKIPANLSREAQTQVTLTIERLPRIEAVDGLSCSFGMYLTKAIIVGREVTCLSPEPDRIPGNDPGKDHVRLELALRFGELTLVSTEFVFYDCRSLTFLQPASPCRACVTSEWNCKWCLESHLCTHKADCKKPLLNQNDSQDAMRGPDLCPYMEQIEGSTLIPVGQQRALKLIGWNLNLLEGDRSRYQCVLDMRNHSQKLKAVVQRDQQNDRKYIIHCQENQFQYSGESMEYEVDVFLETEFSFRIDSLTDLKVTLYNCTIGRRDCSRCQVTADRFGCVWCGTAVPSCVYRDSCRAGVVQTCPLPDIQQVYPLTAPIEGGTPITITGANLGQRAADIQRGVSVVGLPCLVDPTQYRASARIVCRVSASSKKMSGAVTVTVRDRSPVTATQTFTYQDPQPLSLDPVKGPLAGGTFLTIRGSKLLTGSPADIRVFVGNLPCTVVGNIELDLLICRTSPSNQMLRMQVSLKYGPVQKLLEGAVFEYSRNPRLTGAQPTRSFFGGGRVIHVHGEDLDIVQNPRLTIWLIHSDRKRRSGDRIIQPSSGYIPQDSEYSDLCSITSATRMKCRSPAIPENAGIRSAAFVLDNLLIDFRNVTGGNELTYQRNPSLRKLNYRDPSSPYTYKQGNVIIVEGDNLNEAMKMEEVIALIGDQKCVLKTLTNHNLYCIPPKSQPKTMGKGHLSQFTVLMGNLKFDLGPIRYDTEGQSIFTLHTQIGLGVGAVLLVLLVAIIILVYRKKSQKAVRDYRKVLVQLVNLETRVGDQCRKEFTDLMTEMNDLTGDLEGTRIPFLDYWSYAERIFFPGHKESPLRRDLGLSEPRRQTVEQGLNQLANLLNNKVFLIQLIQTLEDQRTFSHRDRGYVASLLTVALHGKLEYVTDIMKTLLSTLIDQYVAKNPKLMLRRTETVVEKLLTNWISLCLYTFLRERAGEPLHMLVRAIKHQVDKGPVDQRTGKAKYTLNDNRLLREDIEYKPLVLNVIVKEDSVSPTIPVKVLDVDTINQAKEKILEQIHKGVPFSQRPRGSTLDLEWRAGLGGHLTLSNEDLTSVVEGPWKRLNTLQHYQVPDGATVALVPKTHTTLPRETHRDYTLSEKTAMLDDIEEEGVKYWHLVKPLEEPEIIRPRRSSVRERERAKAIPEIYLTRLLSMKGIHQKFVDDVFQVILGAGHTAPLAVKFFFDYLDDQAARHGIVDPEIIHIWKTNSLSLRFWLNILKSPHFIFDIQLSDNVDAALSVIAQTFIDSCTTTEHKVGRDSPINKLLYAKEIPRYRQMVEKYYADIRLLPSASYQEMNSALTELSANCGPPLNSTVALHELYKYISKFYDQIMIALESDPLAQKMQLSCRLQQVAALVENKVTDL